jgi:hypothetical protein
MPRPRLSTVLRLPLLGAAAAAPAAAQAQARPQIKAASKSRSGVQRLQFTFGPGAQRVKG